MSVILTTLFSLLSGLPGMLGDYFKKKQEIQVIKVDTERQIELSRQQLAAQLAQAEYERTKASLAATSEWFKYFTFAMWFGPFMVGLVSPSLAASIFSNLAGMPEWYVQSVVLIMFTIWGISTSAPVVTNIFSGMQTFFQERRQYKLDVKKLSIDKKSFYEGIRAVKGRVTEADVKRFDPVIDDKNK